MEENTFLDYNPQFNQGNIKWNNEWGNSGTIVNDKLFSGHDDNAISRWWNPEIAEKAQFDRENYFMDKENAFNEYMYQKALKDNSAAAQMERAKEAGINPSLAAAGIMGAGNAVATPMQGAKGDSGMNTNAVNPIEMIGGAVNTIANGIEGTNKLGEILGFGEKNKAEINLIKENTNKTAEECKFTRRQRIQLQEIGSILVNNARLEGKQIEANIENLKRLNEVYQQQKYNIAADTNLKIEQTGTEVENKKSIWYDNQRKEFEKVIRDMLGVEVTHGEMAMLVEAFISGKGEQMINYFTDLLAGISKGIRNNIKDMFKKEQIEPVITTNPNTGETRPIEFKNKTEKKKWKSRHLENAKQLWEKTSKRKGQSFENYLKIYCSKRGIKITDLLNT